jgi:hypothetical protein
MTRKPGIASQSMMPTKICRFTALSVATKHTNNAFLPSPQHVEDNEPCTVVALCQKEAPQVHSLPSATPSLQHPMLPHCIAWSYCSAGLPLCHIMSAPPSQQQPHSQLWTDTVHCDVGAMRGAALHSPREHISQCKESHTNMTVRF